MLKRIGLTRDYKKHEKEYLDAIKAVCEETAFSGGKYADKFDKEFAAFLGVKYVQGLNNGTSALHCALAALGVGEGDEVIVPAYTYTASASVIDHVGAKIVFMDCAKNSYEMDYNTLEQHINQNTKAIIAVDIAGIPADFDKIYEIVNCKKDVFKAKTELQKAIGRIAVIADSAHSFGARRNGKLTGNIADFSSFSFHAVKNLTTAEGGTVTWRHIEGIDDEELYKEFMLWSLHGQNKDALSKSKSGGWEYDIKIPGYKCNMTDIMAAIGLAQFERYPELLKRRKEIIEKYNEAFKDMNVQVLEHYAENYTSSGHLYLMRFLGLNEEQRNKLIMDLAEKGIPTNVHYKPLPMMTAYKNLGFDIKDYPNAYDMYKNEITLPLHTLLSDEQVEYIIENVKMLGD